MEDKKLVPISVETFILIKVGLVPERLKVESLMEDHYRGIYKISDRPLLTLMEVKVSIMVLDEMLENLISQAHDLKTEKLHMLPTEITFLSSLGRIVSSASETKISSHITLLEH